MKNLNPTRETYEMDLALKSARDKKLSRILVPLLLAGYKDVESTRNIAKGLASGTLGLPSDIAELFSGAFTQGAAEKALMTRPPRVLPPDKPVEVQEGVAPRPELRQEQIGVPKVKYTSADLARRLGLDPDDPETIISQIFSPDLLSKPAAAIKAAKALNLAEGFLPWMAGVFASKRAQTLPRLSLANAEKLEDAKTPAQKIFEETGFWRGPEGQWRFEISDKDIKINPEVLKKTSKSGGDGQDSAQYAPLADVVTHPELFAAYPELKNAYIKFLPPDSSGKRGAFHPDGRVPRRVVEDFENIPTAALGSSLRLFSDDLMGKMTDDGLAFRYPVIEIYTHTRDSKIQKLHRDISLSENIIENTLRNIEYFKKEGVPRFAKGMPLSEYLSILRKNIDEHQTTISKHKKEIESLEGISSDPRRITFDVKSTLVHELQHAIQEIENLPTGGRPLDRSPSEYDSYLRLGGEAEARAAQERLKYADVQAGRTGGLVQVEKEGGAELLPLQFKEWKELQAKEGISPEDALTQTPLSQYDVPLEELSFVYPKEGKAKSAASQILSAEPPPGPIFTSPALNAVREVSKDVLPANQWLRQLQGRGVKEDEIVWTGVGDWLKSRKGNVSKADLEQYLDANQIQIQEVVKGSQGESVELFPDASATKFSDPAYQLPGGENYRELVLTLPEPENKEILRLNEISKRLFDKNYDDLSDSALGRQNAAKSRIAVKREYKRLYGEAGSLAEDRRPIYKGGHYDEPNIVAHIRFNERVDADGNKVLFIEEIQSDWAQKGREKGFKGNPITEADVERKKWIINRGDEIRKEIAELNETQGYAAREKERMLLEERRLQVREFEDLVKKAEVEQGGLPTAPFIMDTNQWVALSLKRMVRWAADNKFDKIGWTTGAQQAARYDLSKQLDSVTIQRRANDESWVITGEKAGVGQNIGIDVDDLSKLDDYIGKELAEKARKDLDEIDVSSQDQELDRIWKRMDEIQTRINIEYDNSIRNAPPELGQELEELQNKSLTLRKSNIYDGVTYSGVDLQVGGEGMKGFYDQIINNQAKALGKKYGAKVDESVVNESSGLQGSLWKHAQSERDWIPMEEQLRKRLLKEGHKVWTLNLTPKLREAARKGLPYMVVLPPVVVGSQMMQQESPSGKIEMFADGEWIQSDPVQVPAAQVRASRILEEAVP
jgi:hypothetical protein